MSCRVFNVKSKSRYSTLQRYVRLEMFHLAESIRLTCGADLNIMYTRIFVSKLRTAA